MEEAARLTRRQAARGLLSALAVLAAAACGRKGPLEPPPDAVPAEERRKPRV